MIHGGKTYRDIRYAGKTKITEPASVAQLDARPTGDQEFAGSTSAGSAIFFREDLIMK